MYPVARRCAKQQIQLQNSPESYVKKKGAVKVSSQRLCCYAQIIRRFFASVKTEFEISDDFGNFHNKSRVKYSLFYENSTTDIDFLSEICYTATR